MIEKEYAKKILEEFLSLPLENSSSVLEKFATLPNAIYHNDGGKLSFVYVPGKRDDRVVLAAHADTVWDKYYNVYPYAEQKLQNKNGIYSGTNDICGIGADDRAGCAILWLLKDTSHSLLILDGEENGQIGAKHLRDTYPKFFDEINEHSYIIQFDRRNANDYHSRWYEVPCKSYDGFAFDKQQQQSYDYVRNANGRNLLQASGRHVGKALRGKRNERFFGLRRFGWRH